MSLELLTCRRMTAGVLYQPLPLQSVDLNRLYADITERYPYQALQHLPDGVRMANPDSDCFVQQTRIQVNENVTYFEASKEKALDIFGIVSEKLSVRSFLTFGIKLIAFMPMSAPDEAAKFIETRALAIRPEEWEILGEGRKGAGIRIVLHQDGIHEVKIEPFFGDPSQLYVEVDVQHTTPFVGLEGVEAKMDAAYNYLFGNVKNFLESLG